MRLRTILEDGAAVTPVVGIILVVAITAILAAVIAGFALGIGNQVGAVASTASFSFDYDAGTTAGSAGSIGLVTVSSDGGEPVSASELYVRGEVLAAPYSGGNTWQGTAHGTVDGKTVVVVGDSTDVGVNSRTYTIRHV